MELQEARDKARVHTEGIVTTRQSPGSAGGVTPAGRVGPVHGREMPCTWSRCVLRITEPCSDSCRPAAGIFPDGVLDYDANGNHVVRYRTSGDSDLYSVLAACLIASTAHWFKLWPRAAAAVAAASCVSGSRRNTNFPE